MAQIFAADFDLGATLNCGQVFHWEAKGTGFVGTIGDAPVSLEQRKARMRFSGVDRKTLSRYFALDHPLAEIRASFPSDETMDSASEFCRGLRIIRQPKWECLATFICSSMKQVAHIRQISHALRQRFGDKKLIYGTHVYAFPTAERLAAVAEKDLRRCGLGYRAKNLLATAKRVASSEADLDVWLQLPDNELHAQLCNLPGVGPKVANCVMLFAYERTRAFPIDVWIARVLRERYFARKNKPTVRRLREFAADYFGEHGGYAQQYLFHYARMTTKRTLAVGRHPTGSLGFARDDRVVRKTKR